MRWAVSILLACSVLVAVVAWTIDSGLGMVEEQKAADERNRRRLQIQLDDTSGTPLVRAAEAPVAPVASDNLSGHRTAESGPTESVPGQAGSAVATRNRKSSRPSPTPPPDTGVRFTVGSSTAQVEAIQGPSTGQSVLPGDRECRYWGDAEVDFRHGFVESWHDAEHTLRVVPPAKTPPTRPIE